MSAAPETFGPEFLAWLKDQTEAAWARHVPADLSDPRAPGGADWQRGTRWLPGLAPAELDALETRWRIRFNPDHRLLLEHLGGTTPPQTGHAFSGKNGAKVQRLTPGFYDWRSEHDEIRAALRWPVEGILYDVADNSLWFDVWGKRPEDLRAAKRIARAQVATWPAMVPLFGHRYALPDPIGGRNPVFSIYQSDMIIYGVDLRRYLLVELASLIGHSHVTPDADSVPPIIDMTSVPGWHLICEA